LESQCDSNGLSFCEKPGCDESLPLSISPDVNRMTFFLGLERTVEMKCRGFHKGLKVELNLLFTPRAFRKPVPLRCMNSGQKSILESI
jgi:hypothetical protein